MEKEMEAKMQGEIMLTNIKAHMATVLKEMPVKQASICNSTKLGAQTLVNLRKQYMDLQDTMHFLQSMYEAIDKALHPEKYESRILTPGTMGAVNPMKVIN